MWRSGRWDRSRLLFPASKRKAESAGSVLVPYRFERGYQIVHQSICVQGRRCWPQPLGAFGYCWVIVAISKVVMFFKVSHARQVKRFATRQRELKAKRQA